MPAAIAATPAFGDSCKALKRALVRPFISLAEASIGLMKGGFATVTQCVLVRKVQSVQYVRESQALALRPAPEV
jgi:hypothetical protein